MKSIDKFSDSVISSNYWSSMRKKNLKETILYVEFFKAFDSINGILSLHWNFYCKNNALQNKKWMVRSLGSVADFFKIFTVSHIIPLDKQQRTRRYLKI